MLGFVMPFAFCHCGPGQADGSVLSLYTNLPYMKGSLGGESF